MEGSQESERFNVCKAKSNIRYYPLQKMREWEKVKKWDPGSINNHQNKMRKQGSWNAFSSSFFFVVDVERRSGFISRIRCCSFVLFCKKPSTFIRRWRISPNFEDNRHYSHAVPRYGRPAVASEWQSRYPE